MHTGLPTAREWQSTIKEHATPPRKRWTRANGRARLLHSTSYMVDLEI